MLWGWGLGFLSLGVYGSKGSRLKGTAKVS